jgi:hypothetical protein
MIFFNFNNASLRNILLVFWYGNCMLHLFFYIRKLHHKTSSHSDMSLYLVEMGLYWSTDIYHLGLCPSFNILLLSWSYPIIARILSFMIPKQTCQCNTTGVTSGTRTAYPSRALVARCLVFCVVFCRSLLSLYPFSFGPCLSFDLRNLQTLLVSWYSDKDNVHRW